MFYMRALCTGWPGHREQWDHLGEHQRAACARSSTGKPQDTWQSHGDGLEQTWAQIHHHRQAPLLLEARYKKPREKSIYHTG